MINGVLHVIYYRIPTQRRLNNLLAKPSNLEQWYAAEDVHSVSLYFALSAFASTKKWDRAQEEVSRQFFLFKKANRSHCV